MNRLTVLRIVLLLLLLILSGRLYQLQLIDREARFYTSTSTLNTRYITIMPRRGKILASDGTTLLAESVPIYNLGVLPGSLPPRSSERYDNVIDTLSQLAGVTSTLTLSPAIRLEQNADLRSDLSQVSLENLPNRSVGASEPLTVTVVPDHTIDAIKLSRIYSDALTFYNPIDVLVSRDDLRSYEPLIIKEDISQELAFVIHENSIHLPGIVVIESYRRRYPYSADVSSLSHFLGYTGRISRCELVLQNPASSWLDSLLDTVNQASECELLQRTIEPSLRGLPLYANNDQIGKDGIEGYYETALRGELGRETLLVDALERPMSAAQTFQAAHDGQNLVLTIDLDFQQQVETIMRRWIAESDMRRQNAENYKREYPPITNGVAVALDPRDGRVLAMVSLPAYDNNIWVDPDHSDELSEMLNPNDPEQRAELERLTPLFNRSIAGRYPPGSTIKQFVGSAALHMEIVTPETELHDPGKIVLVERSGAIFELPNATQTNNNRINISDALMVSSNVFFASIAGGNTEAINLNPDDLRVAGLGIDLLAEGLRWFNFGSATGIDLMGESSGLVPSPLWKAQTLREPWTTGDTYNTAIGQGYLEVTPLQLATAAAAVANNGTVYRPQLVQAITDSSGNILHTMQPEALNTISVSAEYLAVIREGMRRSVTEGRNIAARDECSGLSIAGKTGTAEYGEIIIKPDNQPTRRSHSWFVSFAPYENPEIVVAVLLEGTGDLNDGSATLAVPAVTQIMQAYFDAAPSNPGASFCPPMPN